VGSFVNKTELFGGLELIPGKDDAKLAAIRCNSPYFQALISNRVPGGCLAKRACGGSRPATLHIILPGSVLIQPLPFDSQEATLMHIYFVSQAI
jgi:hypothetical protein